MSTISAEHRTPRPTGRLVDITRPEFKADLFLFYAALRAGEPVCRARVGRMEGWLVTRYDDVLAALKDPRMSKELRRVQGAAELSRRPWLPGFLRMLESNMLDQDDPRHARLRALVHRAFTPARIQALQPRIHAIAGALLDGVQARGELELIRDFALQLPLTVIAELLGVSAAERVRFQRLSRNALLPPTTLNVLRMAPAMWALIRFVRRLLDERRRDPQDDLLTALVEAEEAGDRLSEDEAIAMVVLLLIAGQAQPPPGLWPGHSLLPGGAAGPDGGPDRDQPAARAAARPAAGRPGRGAALAGDAGRAGPLGAASAVRGLRSPV